jgi:hypothetical protein
VHFPELLNTLQINYAEESNMKISDVDGENVACCVCTTPPNRRLCTLVVCNVFRKLLKKMILQHELP